MFRTWFSGFVNRNRRIIFILFLIVVGIMVYLLAMAKMTGFKEPNKTNELNVYRPSETVVSGEKIKEEEEEKNEEIIDKFVQYCNDKEYSKAYSLLTDDCKNLLYQNNEQRFINNYGKAIFNTKKEYNIQAWVNNNNFVTYRIRYMEDALATGDYTNAEKFQDYITIVDINGTQRLNIGKYVGKVSIYKTTTTDELNIEVQYKNVFIDKEEYVLRVRNKTEKEILLDPVEHDTTSIGLIMESGNLHRANRYKQNAASMTVEPLYERTVKLEFANDYGGKAYPVYILINNIILDNDEYKKDTENYDNRVRIEVNL